ncbi:LPXTG cell wall anchor domain-containing protein, partial [Clostridium perfringens]|uniref:LPXTG cell wall anchor domain-containing protein n=1 Tax=Clostridium perfringens TaxID=1502 RepID=UPI002AC48B7D
ESWNAMMDALAKAKEVANNENSTQEEVNEAYRNLENAKNSLVDKDNNDGKPGNGDNNGEGSNNGNNEDKPNNGGKLPSTGGTSSVALSLLGVAMATSGMVISKKKKNK